MIAIAGKVTGIVGYRAGQGMTVRGGMGTDEILMAEGRAHIQKRG